MTSSEHDAVTPSATGLRALSHPLRLRILSRLRIQGPATATTLARELQLNTGATSYHLRLLAQHGFVVEDTERGNARDRWWKAAHTSTLTGAADRTPEDVEDLDAYLHTVALMYTEQLMQAAAERRHLPQPWQRACTTSDWHLRLTPERAEALVDRLFTVISEWDADSDAPGAAPFVVNLNAFPLPGTVAAQEATQ